MQDVKNPVQAVLRATHFYWRPSGGTRYSEGRLTQRATNQSPVSATLQAEYNHPLGSNMERFGGGLFGCSGASKNDPSLTFDDIGSFGLPNLHARVRAADGAWEVTFYAKNIANTVK